nr:MAG: RNA-dependent RNA polymerase [Wenzhou bat phenuivirus 3]
MERIIHLLQPRDTFCISPQNVNVYYAEEKRDQSYYITGFFSMADTLMVTVHYRGKEQRLTLVGENIRKFPHDFTFSHLTQKKEKPLVDQFPFLENQLSRLTPDYAQWVDGQFRIVEFATAKHGIEVNLEKVYERKLLKYLPLASEIFQHDGRVRLDVIVVSRNKVVSSLPLPQVMINLLCKRYLASYIFIDSQRRSNPAMAHMFVSHKRTRESIAPMHDTMEMLNSQVDTILANYKKHVTDIEAPPFDKGLLLPTIFKEKNKMLHPSMSFPTVHDLVDSGGRIDDEDSVSRMPLIIPEVSCLNLDDLIHGLPKLYNTTLGKVWQQAITQFNSDPDRYSIIEHEYAEVPLHTVRQLQALPDHYKYLNYRVEIDLNFDDMLNLAMVGVMAKAYRSHPLILQKRKESQKHFSSLTYTDDIHAFLQNSDSLMSRTSLEDMALAVELLNKAIPETKHSPYDTYRRERDRLYRALVFLADVAVELAASAAQRCKTRKTFILKKMKNWNAFLIIKTTTSDKHVFFSILAHVQTNLDESHVFPQGVKVGNWVMYPFKSAQVPYLQTLITLPEAYLAVKRESKTKELESNLLLGVLIALNSKSDAEEVMTKTRYIYMKGCIRPSQCRDVISCLKGLPSRPRSRLTIYLIKQSINLAYSILDMKGGATDSSIGRWTQIPAFCSEGWLRDWNDVLMVNYIGYFRNKNSVMSANQSAAMIEKILEPEIDMQNDEEYHNHILNGDSFSPRGMEWNAGFIDWACSEWIRSYKSSDFDDIKHQITSTFLHKLSQIKTVDLATLKASNVSTKEDAYTKDLRDIPRQKLLLVLKDEIDNFGPDLRTALPYAIHVIASRGGTMMISLFKKAQHAGLREIYVMDLASRVVQYCLETLGRVICEFFPQEAMTHPDAKLKYRQQHFVKVDAKLNECKRRTAGEVESVTTYSNDDATKWNQYHHVQKFYHFLKLMTDSSIHGFIKIGLSQWLNKRIRVDGAMLHGTYKGRYVTRNPTIKYMQEGFLQQSNCIAKKGMVDLHVESGMMQGLLHYVSSAFHAVVLNGVELIARRLIRGIKEKIQGNMESRVIFEPVITYVVTSDDSVMCMSMISNLSHEQTLLHGNVIINATKTAVSRFAGISTSEKKASHGTVSISEMNSQWMDREQVIKPKVRHILSCFTYSSMGTFVEQQDQLSSLRQQALEAGVPISTISFINYLQGLVYYRMMGSNNAPLFKTYRWAISKLPDPNLGFFLIDPPLLSGCISTDYNIYMASRHGYLATRYSAAVENTQVLLGCKGNLRSDLQSQITFIRDKRYKRLLEDVNPGSIREYFNANPDLLYRQARTPEENKMVLYMKLMSSNVLTALAKDYNTQARLLASSVYMLWAPIIRSNLHLHKVLLGIDCEEPKKSLLEILIEEHNAIEQRYLSGYKMLSETAKQWFFPLHKEYERLAEINAELESRVPHKQVIEPRSSTVVEVYEGFINDIPLPTLCAHRWFQLKDVILPDYLLDAYWEEATSVYAFLHPTHQETLEASQLEYAQTLRAALDRTQIKSKSLRPASRGGRAVRSSGLMTFVSYNFYEDEVLKPEDRVDREDPIRHRLRRMAMMLSTPLNDQLKLKFCEKEINRATINEWRQTNRYALFSLVHKNRSQQLPKLHEIEKLARGADSVVGSWSTRQKKVGRRWVGNGVWTGVLTKHGKSCRLEVHVLDDKVMQLITDDLENMMMMRVKIFKMLDEWRVKTVSSRMSMAVSHLNNNTFGNHGTPIYVRPFMLPMGMAPEMPTLMVRDGQLQVFLDGVVLYNFHPLPEMISEGRPPRKRTTINYILENTPCPFTTMAKTVFRPTTELAGVLSTWIKDMLKQGPEIMPVDEDSYADFEVPMSVQSAPIDMTTLILDQMKELEMDDEDTQEIESMAGHDDMEERVRWFEANLDTVTSIHMHHFHFLRAFRLDCASRIRQIKEGSRFIGEYDDEIYKFFLGEELPYQEPEEEEEWDFEDLDATLVKSEEEFSINFNE